MLKKNRRPTGPGRILREYYLNPRGLSINKFAENTGLTRKHVSNIVNGHAGITSETAIRFARVLETTPQYWLNLQNAVDLYDARKNLAKWRPSKVHPAIAAAE
ncbi:MAG: HigA family addiction module antidote protein [Proteobacteria bacterium]|nr:HigA family addiction module antidote protein [Pseudomonadota bacterium]